MVYELFGHTDLKMLLKQKIQTKHLYTKMYFFGLKILKKLILRATQIYTEREGVQKISARSWNFRVFSIEVAPNYLVVLVSYLSKSLVQANGKGLKNSEIYQIWSDQTNRQFLQQILFTL